MPFLGGGGPISLGDLADVDISGASDTQVLLKEGNLWVPGDVQAQQPAQSFALLAPTTGGVTPAATGAFAVDHPEHLENDHLLVIGYRDDSGVISPPSANGWVTEQSTSSTRAHIFTRQEDSGIEASENFSTANSAVKAWFSVGVRGEDVNIDLLQHNASSTNTAIADITGYRAVLIFAGSFTSMPSTTGLIQMNSNTVGSARIVLYRVPPTDTSLAAKTFTGAVTVDVIGIV